MVSFYEPYEVGPQKTHFQITGTGVGKRGFSVIELMIVVAIILIVATAASLNISTVLKNARINTALENTVNQLRMARQGAIDQRCIYVVTFTAPRTIRMQRIVNGLTSDVGTLDLPRDVEFRAETGIPNSPATTPDQFGIGRFAIDFSVDFGGAGTQLYFQPDGSALDNLGRVNNGVVYIARPGELPSSRAVSVFGSTGRIRSWRLAFGAGGAARWQ